MALAGGVSTSLREAQKVAAPWPYARLDLEQLSAAGWRPVPLRDLVLKVHQLCNLACDYCYVYESADQTWRDRPSLMSEDIWKAAVDAFARHAEKHRLDHVRVILHGGEPLLFRMSRIEQLIGYLHRALPAKTTVRIGMQTNGVLLTRPVVEHLVRLGVSVGVSVDGAQPDHDRHRRNHAGRGSFAAVSRALHLLREPANRASYSGILCTVAPHTDPVGCYEALAEFDPPMIDFLLPHSNWDSRPPHTAPDETAYADWLIAVFDHWRAKGSKTRIRIFDDIVELLLGGTSGSEQVGLSPAGMLVIESDGAIEQVDALKSAYPAAAATGLNILTDELDAVYQDAGIVARQLGLKALSPACRSCPVHPVCGGGHYAHRYRSGQGFFHPSVYCNDMRRLIDHISDRVSAGLRHAANSEG